MQNDDFKDFDIHLNEEFRKIRKKIKEIKYPKLDEMKKPDLNRDLGNEAREELTKTKIEPFLNEYHDKIVEITKGIKEFLEKENSSDNDIISMI